jgi:hypothetical protein
MKQPQPGTRDQPLLEDVLMSVNSLATTTAISATVRLAVQISPKLLFCPSAAFRKLVLLSCDLL